MRITSRITRPMPRTARTDYPTVLEKAKGDTQSGINIRRLIEWLMIGCPGDASRITKPSEDEVSHDRVTATFIKRASPTFHLFPSPRFSEPADPPHVRESAPVDSRAQSLLRNLLTKESYLEDFPELHPTHVLTCVIQRQRQGKPTRSLQPGFLPPFVLYLRSFDDLASTTFTDPRQDVYTLVFFKSSWQDGQADQEDLSRTCEKEAAGEFGQSAGREVSHTACALWRKTLRPDNVEAQTLPVPLLLW